MANDILNKLNIKVKQKEDIKINIKKKEDKKSTIRSQKKKKYKEYTLQEILKNKNWIIFEHGEQKWVYKISKNWFNNHPGGETALNRGVKANSYYDKKNKNRSDISPTQLFKSVGVHGTSGIFKEYIIDEKHPSKIRKIGLFK